MMDVLTAATSLPLLGAAAIKWTPVTFYVATGIIDAIVIMFGYRLLQVDPEHNSFIGAVVAAALINVIGYFVRDTGLVGVLIHGGAIFGLLVAISSGEALKAGLMTGILVALYGGIGMFVLPRTPLTVDDVAGFTRVVMGGGLQAEPITEEDEQRLAAPPGQTTP